MPPCRLEIESCETKSRGAAIAEKPSRSVTIAIIGVVVAVALFLTASNIIHRNGSKQANAPDLTAQPWWIANKMIPGGTVRTVGTVREPTFSEEQQRNFGVNDQGKVLNQTKFDAELARVQKIREEVLMDEISLEGFPEWRAHILDSKVVHLKGFGHGMGIFYNDEVLALLKDCELLVWDGDPFDTTGFTEIVPHFLKWYPTAQAVAFKKHDEVDSFKEKWASTVREFPGRIAVVPLDLIAPDFKDARRFGVTEEMRILKGLPNWAQEYFLLGRTAIKATDSKLVIALGGGGIAAKEAQVGIDSGQEWHVFALSRGSKEEHPSLLNWAATAPIDRVKLVRGKDPHEEDAFAPETQ